jgi:hypothetical protein
MKGHAVVVAMIQASEATISVNAAFANSIGSNRWLTRMRIRTFLLDSQRSSLGDETSYLRRCSNSKG